MKKILLTLGISTATILVGSVIFFLNSGTKGQKTAGISPTPSPTPNSAISLAPPSTPPLNLPKKKPILYDYLSSEAKISFSHPYYKNLEISNSDGTVNIEHPIPYKGNGICGDESGRVVTSTKTATSTVAKWDELKITIKFVTSSIRELFPDYDNDIKPDSFGYSHLEKIKIGNKEGFTVLNAVEMCGTIDYYFPSPSGTLIISDDAQNVALRNMGKFKDTPGALSSDQETEFLKTLVETAQPIMSVSKPFSADPNSPKFLMKQERNDSKYLMASISYPEISGLRNTEIEKQLNETIKKLFVLPKEARYLEDIDPECLKDGNLEASCSSSFDLNGHIVQLTPKYLSMAIGNYEYFHGAAHPNHNGTSFNYDIEFGKEIGLGDIFINDSYPKVLAKITITALVKQMDVPEDDEMLVEGTASDNFVNHSFLITNKGLAFGFNDYEVGSYVAGNPEVVIDYKQIEDLLTPEFKEQIKNFRQAPDLE